jgi:hypothetical protein
MYNDLDFTTVQSSFIARIVIHPKINKEHYTNWNGGILEEWKNGFWDNAMSGQ